MKKPFHEMRRQLFITEPFFNAAIKYCDEGLGRFARRLTLPEIDLEDKSQLAASTADFSYRRFSLRYTAGEPIETLRDELTGVIEAYERFQVALAAYEEIPEVAPLGLGNIGDYERCMQLIGLCYLLHRRDLLPRISALQDPAYIGTDALYEDLLRYGLTERPETDEMLNLEAYDLLLGAIWEASDTESASLLQQYVEQWYPNFKYIPWHDGHLRIVGNEGDYFGYWAFEAGAVALLCDIDDSAITHMVYPKDLVAWARANAHLSDTLTTPTATEQHRCEANHPCPKAGYWFTPARINSRRLFQQGEVMPDVGGDYGATIWQWDTNQS